MIVVLYLLICVNKIWAQPAHAAMQMETANFEPSVQIFKPELRASEQSTIDTYKVSRSLQSHLDVCSIDSVQSPIAVAISNDALQLAVFDSQTANGPHALKLISIKSVDRSVRTFVGPNSAGYLDGSRSLAQFNGPTGLAFSYDDSWLAVADASNNAIRRVNMSTGVVTTLAGFVDAGYADGRGTAAQFNYPRSVAFSPDGSFLFVADSNSNTIRQIRVSDGTVSTLAGLRFGPFPNYVGGFQDGRGSGAVFNYPQGLAVSADGTTLFVADTNNHAVRRVDVASAAVSTVAGSGYPGSNDGASAQFKQPGGVARHPTLPLLAVADTGNHRIRTLDLAAGTAAPLAGAGATGLLDGPAPAARKGNRNA